MTRRFARRASALAVIATVGAWLALPGSAAAHAYLVRTVPAASEVLSAAPTEIRLTFDEAVEPRFAIISVTDAQGHQQTTAPVGRSAANADTLVVPVRRHPPEGWYLIYWRAISVDGHPVSGAFTYAVGPNPGPAPEFRVPSISATAITPQLLIARWVMLVAVMLSIGAFVFRLVVIRPVIRRLPELRLRALSITFLTAGAVGLIAVPVYLDFATANDALRSVFDVGSLAPLFGVAAFGRALLRLELCFALFCVAGSVAIWVERLDLHRRTVAELAASCGALLAGGAALIIPGTAGHPAQTSPRGLTLTLDWVHLAAGSIWLGGLAGLLALWFALPDSSRVGVLASLVPRFSVVAAGSVAALGASGVGETLEHLPSLDALWLTGFGRAILVKTGLLVLALGIASGNLLRSRPRLIAAHRQRNLGSGAAGILRTLVTGELIVVGGAVLAAAVLTSLPPPPPAFALQSRALVRVGPGTVARTFASAGYRFELLVAPNRAAAPDSFALRITRGGRPLRGAQVRLVFNMTTMQMPQQEYQLVERAPGVYSRATPALVMVGVWGLTFQITPRHGSPFDALVLDQADG